MRKKIAQYLGFAICLGIAFGFGIGRVYFYVHPMNNIEGYWEINYDFNKSDKNYHVFSRVSILNREISSSADVYDDDNLIRARRNIVFNVLDVGDNIFIGKVSYLSMVNDDDSYLYDFLNTPYAVSHPVFYKINENTLLMEQSQGHPVNNLRLLTRVNR
ncbi:Uncharacterised protein [Yersinia rohdei]|uniref:Uncharacterized protein n=1 Tax=Yersinia rohdei TaxID=29485 RepID=A0A0U1HWT0_YERRO|nr:hypothetical protein [Yersinia rohdei]CNE88400.1 Uncharacterised protein [Yersinia rohdei]CQI95681.1 Uncharacterised protein [Yersinia rohdei]CQJ49872.1 Uncharacterised protein [Yersinia rohdei]